MPTKFIQISDTHLFGDDSKDLLGVKTCESYQALVDYIHENESGYDFILHSGDISQDGSEESYRRLADKLMRFDCPVYYVPGNHDHPQNLAKSYPCANVKTDKHIVLDQWQLILLDSQIPGHVEGELKTSQFRFIEDCLKANPKEQAILVFHHQPFDVGCTWLDPLGLTNKETFWEFIKSYPVITKVLFGHVHQLVEKEIQNVHCYSTPSSCIQFKPKQVEFALDKQPPAYRVITLHEDGRFETELKRTDCYVGHFEIEAKGY